MAIVTTPEPQQGFGATARTDTWWLGPLATLVGLLIFVFYANWATFQGKYFEIRQYPEGFTGKAVAPYLTPFYSPLLYDATSEHAWFHKEKPSWWPLPFFSAALLILPFPLLFRFTCYYYRKAYYRAFWADPPACAVGEPRRSYWGENRWPLLFQNIHRYAMYFALIFIVLLSWDVILAFM